VAIIRLPGCCGSSGGARVGIPNIDPRIFPVGILGTGVVLTGALLVVQPNDIPASAPIHVPATPTQTTIPDRYDIQITRFPSDITNWENATINIETALTRNNIVIGIPATNQTWVLHPSHEEFRDSVANLASLSGSDTCSKFCTLRLPQYIEPGEYSLVVYVTPRGRQNVIATAYRTIRVGSPAQITPPQIEYQDLWVEQE
jgi:hypothetical protein